MKKIICVLLFVAEMLYAWDLPWAVFGTRRVLFESCAKEYYKAWAVGYCLGYYTIKNDQEIRELEDIPYEPKINFSHFDQKLKVENIVYTKDTKALNELTMFIDKRQQWLDEDRVNRCLLLTIPRYGKTELDKEVERIVKKYCKECK